MERMRCAYINRVNVGIREHLFITAVRFIRAVFGTECLCLFYIAAAQYLPDKYATIAADPRYAVRLANVDTWDETTGLNDLKADIVVSASAPLEPDELPELIDALPTVSADKTAEKILENGVLYIVHNGVRYTVSGQITE